MIGSWTTREGPHPFVFSGRRIVVLLLAAHAVIVFSLALVLETGYFDGFAYLEGAAAVLDPARRVPPTRPPLLTLALVPVVAWGRAAGTDALFRAGFLLAAAAACGSVAAAHRVSRRIGKGRDAALALALVILLPDVLHYGPFPMHDLFAAGLVLAGLSRYVAARAQGNPFSAAILWGLAIATRYPLAVLPPAFLFAEHLRSRGGDPIARRAVARPGFASTTLLLPALVVSILALSLYGAKTGSVSEGAVLWTRIFFSQLGQPYDPATNPPWEYAADAALQFSLPLALLALLGAGAGLRDRRPGTFFAAVVAVTLFAVHSALGPKESRYLLPVWMLLPALALRALARARFGGRWIPYLLLVLALPAAARTLGEFRDPIYTRPFWRPFLEEIHRAPPDAPVVITGWTTPLYPRDLPRGPIDVLDEYRSVYHFGIPQIAAFSARPMRWTDDTAALAAAIDAGAIAVRLHEEATNRSNLPANPPPLELDRRDGDRRIRRFFYPPR